MAPSRPCISGRPGRIATFQNDSAMPSAANALPHQIVVANRSAAGRHQNIGVKIAGAPHRVDRLIEVIGHDAEIGDGCAFGARQRGKRKTVRIDDLARTRLNTRRHELIAGGEQRDFRLPMYRQQRMVHAGSQREIARGEPMAFGEQRFA